MEKWTLKGELGTGGCTVPTEGPERAVDSWVDGVDFWGLGWIDAGSADEGFAGDWVFHDLHGG